MGAVLDKGGDIAEMRRRIYAKDAVSRDDLAALLTCADASADFARLLADVATDLLVRQADPEKYVSQADADWFVGALRESAVGYDAKIAALIDVLRYAASAPASLEAYCVGEIEQAIVKKDVVTPADTQALREAVFAAVEGSALHVTRESAESLFRIAHAVNGAANDSEFDAFFAKAIGNYLMGLAFRWTPSAQDEREKERWLDEKPQGFDAFVAAMFAGGGGFDLRSTDDRDEARARAQNEADARDMAVASEIDAGETQWLLAHLSRAGELTSAEKALLEFLRQEAPSLPEALGARMGEAA
jgi:hypothetical protein